MTHKRYNIILDLDQTLISGEEADTHNPKRFYKKSKLIASKKLDDSYFIYERPHLQPFLDFLFKHFNVSIWTAASKGYAQFILSNIILTKSNRKIEYFMFHDHCKVSEKKRGSTKDLDMIFSVWKFPGYNRENTLIIDDLQEVYKTQPDNCISIPPFEFTKKGSHKDAHLVKVMNKLKELIHP